MITPRPSGNPTRRKTLITVAVGAAVALAGVAGSRLLAGGHEAAPEAPALTPPPLQAPAAVESAPPPVREVAPVEAQRPAARSIPIEDFRASTNPLHRSAMLALARAREDAVDACRDKVTLPKIEKLLPWATVVERTQLWPNMPQEISMDQLVVFEIATSVGRARLVWAKVMETWLEFPDSSGSYRRAPFSDAALDRCVEKALGGASVELPGAAAGETFRIQGSAGEAVFDLR